MSQVVRQFFVRAPDAHTITVFTSPPVAPPTVTRLLSAAAALLPGTSVRDADFASHVSSGEDKSSYIFGTGGWLQYPSDQSRNTLEHDVRVVADTIIRLGFLVWEPLEVDDRVK